MQRTLKIEGRGLPVFVANKLFNTSSYSAGCDWKSSYDILHATGHPKEVNAEKIFATLKKSTKEGIVSLRHVLKNRHVKIDVVNVRARNTIESMLITQSLDSGRMEIDFYKDIAEKAAMEEKSNQTSPIKAELEQHLKLEHPLKRRGRKPGKRAARQAKAQLSLLEGQSEATIVDKDIVK